MKTFCKTLPIVILVLLTSFLIMISKAEAAVFSTPYFDWQSNFSYDGGTNELTFTEFDVTKVAYLDGTFGNVSTDDTIMATTVDWRFLPGYSGLFNSDGDNLNFSGAARFEIYDTVSDEIFLTGTLSNFQFSQQCWGTFCLNPTLNTGFTLNSLWNLDANNSSTSLWVQEMAQFEDNQGYNNGYNTDISITSTTFTSGTDYQFINTSGGIMLGKVVTLPEPVSMVLFISGGAVLAIRRFSKKNKKNLTRENSLI